MRITTGSTTQTGEIHSGGSYLSQSDLRLHFGLGPSTHIDTLEVLWPYAAPQVFHNLVPDRFYTLTQGGELHPAASNPRP